MGEEVIHGVLLLEYSLKRYRVVFSLTEGDVHGSPAHSLGPYVGAATWSGNHTATMTVIFTITPPVGHPPPTREPCYH